VSPVKYELGFCIPKDAILHSDRRENLKFHIALAHWPLLQRRNVSPVKYELGFYIPEDVIHSHRRDNLQSYIVKTGSLCWRGRRKQMIARVSLSLTVLQ
jgi:hypothetical protein